VVVPTIGNFLAVVGNQPSQTLTMAVEQTMRSHVPVVPLVVLGNGESLLDTLNPDFMGQVVNGLVAAVKQLNDTGGHVS
jgi:hypothetical protein